MNNNIWLFMRPHILFSLLLIASSFNGTYAFSTEKNTSRKTISVRRPALPKTIAHLNPLHKMSKDARQLIEEYKKKRTLAQNKGVETYYDELMSDADELIKEFEQISNHESTSLLFLKHDRKSQKDAFRLIGLMQRKTRPFNVLLWKIDQLLENMQQQDEALPDAGYKLEIAYNIPLIPATKKVQEIQSVPSRLVDEDENDQIIQAQPTSMMRTQDEDLLGLKK